jgi:polar amino acid transport system permease protein/polar amino acid transport system substrate-binding protein
LYELLGASTVRGSQDFRYLEAYAAAAVYYLAIVSVLMAIQAQLERRFTWSSTGRRRQRRVVVAPAVPAGPHDAR